MVILIVSHVHLLREALVASLQGAKDHQAFGASSRETVEGAALEFAPSLVIVDASHPEGAALVGAVRMHVPQVKVIVLAMRDRVEDFLAWAEIGISGFLGPDASARDLLSMVRRVGAGEVVCPPRLTALLLTRLSNRSSERATRAGIYTLTAREREVAELLADGLSNKLIACRLHVALATVKNHVHSILDKWELQSRGEAAARYREKVKENVQPNKRGCAEPYGGHVPYKWNSVLQHSEIPNQFSSTSRADRQKERVGEHGLQQRLGTSK